MMLQLVGNGAADVTIHLIVQMMIRDECGHIVVDQEFAYVAENYIDDSNAGCVINLTDC